MAFFRADLLHACKVLNVSETAHADLWRSAYRLKARELHPDLVSRGRKIGIVEARKIHDAWLDLDKAWKWFQGWQAAGFPPCEAVTATPSGPDPDLAAAVGSARDLVRPAAVGLADLAGGLLLKKVASASSGGGPLSDVLGKGLQSVVEASAAKLRDYVGNLLTPKPK